MDSWQARNHRLRYECAAFIVGGGCGAVSIGVVRCYGYCGWVRVTLLGMLGYFIYSAAKISVSLMIGQLCA